MLQETKIMKQAFIKRTGKNPIKFRLWGKGSMRGFIDITIQGKKEDYEILNKSRLIGDIKITFIQNHTFFKIPQIQMEIHIGEFKNELSSTRGI